MLLDLADTMQNFSIHGIWGKMKRETQWYKSFYILLAIFFCSFQSMHLEDFAVIKDGGTRVYIKGMVEYDLERITEEQLVELENNFDDIEAPPGPYKIQPENQGKNN